nr:MAG TPA: hypothetical protein [Caudoviricetes sp.]
MFHKKPSFFGKIGSKTGLLQIALYWFTFYCSLTVLCWQTIYPRFAAFGPRPYLWGVKPRFS